MPDFYTMTRAHRGAKPGVSPLVSSGTKRRIQGVLDTPWKHVELFRHAHTPEGRSFGGVFCVLERRQMQAVTASEKRKAHLFAYLIQSAGMFFSEIKVL